MACTQEDTYESPHIYGADDGASETAMIARIADALEKMILMTEDGEVTEAMMHAGSELLSDVSRWQLGRGQLAKQVYLAMRAARREA